jgi:hypothetical protein
VRVGWGNSSQRTEIKMDMEGGKKLGIYEKPRVTVVHRARGPLRTPADVELDRAMRALFYGARDQRGRAVNKNFRNVARGATHPWRALIRRFHEAKRARNAAHNYPLMKQAVRELDRYVDALFGRELYTTGDFSGLA